MGAISGARRDVGALCRAPETHYFGALSWALWSPSGCQCGLFELSWAGLLLEAALPAEGGRGVRA
eukprot:3788845-Pyramimonas_sp.AAC.1